MMHVFQFTLTGCPSNSACPDWLDVWFREGQAIGVSGSHSLPTLSDFQAWAGSPSKPNSFLIKRWTDYPDQESGGSYYPVFGLVYAYLTDSALGLGASSQDFLTLFELMDGGASFEVAFETALGISIAELSAEFPGNIEAFLEGKGR